MLISLILLLHVYERRRRSLVRFPDHMGLKDSLRDEHDRSGAELHGCTLC
jgi:hypothetical protein